MHGATWGMTKFSLFAHHFHPVLSSISKKGNPNLPILMGQQGRFENVPGDIESGLVKP